MTSQEKTFVQNVIRGKALVYDLRLRLNGAARYFIVQVSPAKRDAFLRAVEADAGFTIEDFGKILHRGFGEPEEALKADLHSRYGL